MTNEEYITRIVEQDEDFCIITDEVNGTVNIEVSLDWWKKQSNSDEDCISRNAIIETLNEMDRYIIDELTLCDSNNKFPQNEVFIVDDVYEQIAEQLPPVTPKSKTDVLDKIRAEIEQNAYPIVHGVNNHEKGMTLYGILEVIDKYKTESEE